VTAVRREEPPWPEAAQDGAAAAQRATRTFRVVIADDHPLYRAALAQVVRSSELLTLVGLARDGREAFALIKQHRPDVAVLDVRMPIWDGLAVAQRVQRDELPTRVLFVSEYEQGDLVFNAIAAGGAGYLTKASDGRQILDGILRVARGEAALADEVGAGLLHGIRSRNRVAGLLTTREHEVLTAIAAGCTAPQIAKRLHLAVPTVKTHIQNLYGKLGVSDRGAAVAEAMRRGLID
jgi:two-component system nitrate/nitrite response regulator NarL